MVFLLGFAKKEILFPLSFAAFFRRKLGKEPYAPALQQKMLSLRSGRKKPGTFRRKGGAACRWHVSSAVLRCRVGRSYRSPPGTKIRSGAETALRRRSFVTRSGRDFRFIWEKSRCGHRGVSPKFGGVRSRNRRFWRTFLQKGTGKERK